jgi:hypothetical protein
VSDQFDMALRLVLNMLPDHGITPELIRDNAERVVSMLSGMGDAPELDVLVREVEALVVVRQDAGASLVDPEGHVEWLLERRADDVWTFWDRYRRYLEDVQHYPRAVVLRLDEVTDSILGKLEDPRRPGPWDRRGLVVGQVQSGKTSNYTGLVCKAADAGFKLIVVLAGIHNSLRSQTQLRLDEGFLGKDSQAQTRGGEPKDHSYIGAGAMPGVRRPLAGSLTTSAESGDFKTAQARNLALPIGDMPVILVVKKNGAILKNLLQYILAMHGEVREPGERKQVWDLPLLIIDDEADNASIDTTAEDQDDPTKINGHIRRLLHAFDRSAYVGYTATPFANIYADPYADHDDVGNDIFPRSFIEVLRAPSNYFGPERVFGLTDDDRGAVPIHRAIEDHDEWIPDRHKAHWQPPADNLPASLRSAMLDFILTCAVRRARGQVQVHNSMLVHVTRFQDVQQKVSDQVSEALLLLRDRLRHGDGDDLVGEFEARYDDDYAHTTDWFKYAGHIDMPAWEAVRAELLPAATKITVRTMNGRSRDALDYYEQRQSGLSVIAIGGDKLSRGLTLEGLSVSYYLRASKMYDTLMQMGRWFGYRPGYEDLCRLYTTPDLRAWYREITQSTEELRLELEEMAAQGATPIEYGLRVRTSPAGLSVTAANKMRRAQKVRLSFSGTSSETVLFDTRPAVLRANRSALEDLIVQLGDPQRPRDNGNLLWRGDLGDAVATFLDRYRSDPMAWRVRPDLIAQYVRRGMAAGELDDWTVALISNETLKEGEDTVAGHRIGLTRRQLIPDEDGSRSRELREEHRYAIRRVLSPADEVLGLESDQEQAALAATRHARPGAPLPSGPSIRLHRRPGQALLLLYVLGNTEHSEHVEQPMVGFAFSFPHSGHDIAAEYAVNRVWQQLQADGLVLPEDEQ